MEDNNTNYNELVKVAVFDNYILANMALGLLEQNNIFCYLKDEHSVTIDPMLSNAMGGIKLMVHPKQKDEAIELIKQAENNYAKEFACEKCNEKTLEIFEKTNTPTSLWGLIWNRIAFGQSTTHYKKYRCKNCFTIFDELPLNNDNGID